MKTAMLYKTNKIDPDGKAVTQIENGELGQPNSDPYHTSVI